MYTYLNFRFLEKRKTWGKDNNIVCGELKKR